MTYPQRSGRALRRNLRWRCLFVFEGRQALMRTLLFGLFLEALLWAAPVTAQERAGRFVSVQGSVEVLRGSQSLPATDQLPLQTGDVIRTGPNARAAILLSDGTKLKLGANSTIQLKRLSPERLGKVTPVAAGGLQTVMHFFLGEGWLQRTGPPDALEIETPTVRAATKGTEFALDVAPDGSTIVSVLDGHVRVTNPQGDVLVAEGEQAWIGGTQWMNLKYGVFPKEYPYLGQGGPAKRALRNRLDAVQWSLYYRGTVSPKDYPALPPEELAEFEAILALYRARQLTGAREQLQVARTARPTAPALLDLAALLFLAQGQIPEAKAALGAALTHDPTDAAAHALLAEVALVQNRIADAAAEADQAIAANRQAPSAWLAVSHVRQSQFRLEEALQAAAQARTLDPQDIRALVQEATLLFWMDRTDEAWALTQRAQALAPHDATVLSLLGFLELARGEKQAALGSFRLASETDSTLGEPHLGTGLVLLRLGQVAEAVEEIEAATMLESQDALFRGYLGESLYCSGFFERICRRGSRW